MTIGKMFDGQRVHLHACHVCSPGADVPGLTVTVDTVDQLHVTNHVIPSWISPSGIPGMMAARDHAFPSFVIEAM